MLICIKKVEKELEFERILKPTMEDFKSIVGATTLKTRQINDNIVCIYDFNNLDTNNKYNFVMLEEIKCSLELVEAIKGTVIFARMDSNGEFEDLTEEDVSYLVVNYMKNTCLEPKTNKRYDTLEIFA